jgi:glycosyltransferase involved in cell wall biosynthesis
VHSSYLTHDNYERFYKHDKYREKLQNNRYSNLDGIYFVSNDSMEEFKEVLGEYPNMHVIHNIIDSDSVKKKAQEQPALPQSSRFSFSAVGSLMAVKGFDRLIRASGIVRDRGYNFELQIVGAGVEEHNLKKLTRDLDLESRVVFHGFVKNPYPVMKNSDVFVMSSVSEALPTVLCEAMILGVPSLVTNCSGCRGLVGHGEYGLMAEQNDSDLAEKMIRYMENPELLDHYHEKSLERASLFEDKRILQAYYNVFNGKEPSAMTV